MALVISHAALGADNPAPRSASPESSIPGNLWANRMSGTRIERDLPYVTNGHPRQKLDLYLPTEGAGPWPVIVWMHGGGWASGSKDNCGAWRQVQRGYAVASIGYRLSGDAPFPAQIEDCKAAIRWLRANASQYHLDAKHIAAWGSSAGGHLVALLGTSGGVKEFDVGANLDHSSRIQAVCDFYGPTDLLQMDEHGLRGTRLKHDLPDSPESRLIGGPIQENKAKVARANPITYVASNSPPFLIVHGDQDPTVPWHQSQLLFDALRAAGVSVRFHTVEDAGHGKGIGGPDVDEAVNAFFDRCLKGNPGEVKPTATITRSQAQAMPPGRPRPVQSEHREAVTN